MGTDDAKPQPLAPHFTIEDLKTPEARTFALKSARPEYAMSMIEDVYSIDCPKRWFVAYTAPKLEQKVCERAEKSGIGSFTPVARSWAKQSRRQIHQKKPRVEIVRPLLTRYVFIRLPVKERIVGGIIRAEIPFGAVRLIEGVHELIGTLAGPISVTDRVVEKVLLRQQRGDFDTTRQSGKRNTIIEKWMAVGVDVVVRNGPFTAFLGLIEEILPNDRIKVGVSIFGRTTPVELDLDDVRQLS